MSDKPSEMNKHEYISEEKTINGGTEKQTANTLGTKKVEKVNDAYKKGWKWEEVELTRGFIQLVWTKTNKDRMWH